MPLPRLLLRLVLGRRLPTTSGELRVPGLSAPLTIRRDSWGIPHVEAASGPDAIFGLGFCQGQDRAFQLETLLRIGRGTLAELVGVKGLGLDRVSRRVGFRRAAVAQLAVHPEPTRAALEAYVAGVNAGRMEKPHELALLRGELTPWDAADVLAFLKVQSFLLPSNWDVELARLRILHADGPDALLELDPAGVKPLPPTPSPQRGGGEDSSSPPRCGEGPGEGFLFGGSNAFVIAGSRTASGKPLLANDPHLAPVVPAPWYLAHLTTPTWSVAGATLTGSPVFPAGHNGTACWGTTAALADNTDLFLETLGPDGKSVRRADGTFEPCEVVREVIRVKGKPDVVEEVLVTPRGPVLTTMGKGRAVSLRAVWLDPFPVRGIVGAHESSTFEAFRRSFADWPGLPLCLVYADAEGTTGWQLAGRLPVRAMGNGTLPLPADAPGVGWEAEPVPFEAMPFTRNPERGFQATANNDPGMDGGPFLGVDFLDGYRAEVLNEELAKKDSGWTVADCQRLQLNLRSKPWDEMRDTVLSLPSHDADVREGLEVLREWDGNLDPDSSAAAVFELFVAELSVRVAKAKAPKTWRAAVGGGGDEPFAHNLFAARRVSHLVRLLREQPTGWFPRGWSGEMAEALATAVRFLRSNHGPGAAWWQWGDVRMLAVRHPLLGKHRLLGPAFNLPAVPVGGDANTVSQASSRPTNPTAPPHFVANLRAVFDTADWSACRFALCGGQSGNPCSPHYDDLFELWCRGEGVAIPWTAEEVLRVSRETLRLVSDAS